MKTVIVSSSQSPKSKSFILAKEVEKKLIEHNIEVTFIDLRDYDLNVMHKKRTQDQDTLSATVAQCDNIILATGIYNYSICDSLKVFVDTCLTKDNCAYKFYGIVCAAGGNMSYLAAMHLTQMCQNHNKMIQLPDIVYGSHADFTNDTINSTELNQRIDDFSKKFIYYAKKLL